MKFYETDVCLLNILFMCFSFKVVSLFHDISIFYINISLAMATDSSLVAGVLQSQGAQRFRGDQGASGAVVFGA